MEPSLVSWIPAIAKNDKEGYGNDKKNRRNDTQGVPYESKYAPPGRLGGWSFLVLAKNLLPPHRHSER